MQRPGHGAAGGGWWGCAARSCEAGKCLWCRIPAVSRETQPAGGSSSQHGKQRPRRWNCYMIPMIPILPILPMLPPTQRSNASNASNASSHPEINRYIAPHIYCTALISKWFHSLNTTKIVKKKRDQNQRSPSRRSTAEQNCALHIQDILGETSVDCQQHCQHLLGRNPPVSCCQ